MIERIGKPLELVAEARLAGSGARRPL